MEGGGQSVIEVILAVCEEEIIVFRTGGRCTRGFQPHIIADDADSGTAHAARGCGPGRCPGKDEICPAAAETFDCD